MKPKPDQWCVLLALICLSFAYQFIHRPSTVTPELEWAVSKIKSAIFIAAVVIYAAIVRTERKP